MGELYIDELQKYIRGSEFRQNLEMFVDANCMQFHNTKGEFTRDHFDLWKSYQDIVENILEMALGTVGGSIETLEKVLDEIAYDGDFDSSPKAAAFQDIVKRLLTYENFESFRDMMITAAHHKLQEEDGTVANYKKYDPNRLVDYRNDPYRDYDTSGLNENDPNVRADAGETDEDNTLQYYIDTLQSMGYKASLIDEVLGEIDENDMNSVSLEGLMNRLAELQTYYSTPTKKGKNSTGGSSSSASAHQQNGSQGAAAGQEGYEYPTATEEGEYEAYDASAYDSTGYGDGSANPYGYDSNEYSDDPYFNYRRYCHRVAKLLVDFGDTNNANTSSSLPIPKDDMNELDAKFVMAQSVLDNFNAGITGPEVVNFLHWATSMLELLGDVEAAYYGELSTESSDGGDGSGVPMSEYTSSRAPDGLVLQYAALEDMRIKIEEEGGASGASDLELKRMAALNAIAESGSEDEQVLHKIITRHEEVRREIDALHKKLSLYVSSKNYAIKRENIEELYLYLKEKVQSGVEITAEMQDEMHELVYHTTVSQASPELAMEVLSRLLELNVLEDEECLLRQRIQELVGAAPPKSEASPGGLFAEEVQISEWKDEKEGDSSEANGQSASSSSNDANNVSDEGKSPEKKHTDLDTNAESKSNSTSDGSAGGAGGGGGEKKGGRSSNENEEENAALIDALKNKHLKSLTALKDRLKGEKDRRLQELEDRLMRRKLARKKLVAAGGEVDESELAGDEEIEAQISSTTQEMNKVAEGLLSGLKKRCLAEMRTIKTKNSNGRPSELTEEEKREAQRTASADIIKRYERDQKSLLTSLEAQRIKQRNKTLERAKAKASKNKALGPDGVTPEVEEELKQIDEYFKEQVCNALQEPQDAVMVALSSVNAPELVEGGKKGTGRGDDEDEDDYLDDDDADKKGGTKGDAIDMKAWLDDIEGLKKKYKEAGKSLQHKLIDAHYREVDGEFELVDPASAGEDGGFVDLSGHMLKVITEAYYQHASERAGAAEDESLNDFKSSCAGRGRAYGHGKAGDEGMDDRIKAGIMNEFERSRDGYSKIIESQEKASKKRLAARRAKNKKGGGNSAADPEEIRGWGEEDEAELVNSGGMPASAAMSHANFDVIVDSFLDEPVAAPDVKVVKPNERDKQKGVESGSKSFHKPKTSTLPPIGSSGNMKSAEKKPLEQLTTEAGLTPAQLRQQHMEKEKTLMDSLQTQMVQKKRLLEDRLKRKREQRAKTEMLQAESGGKDNGRVVIAQQEEELAETEVSRLMEVYENLTRMIKETPGTKISMVDMEGVMRLMDKAMQGQAIKELPLFEVEDKGGPVGVRALDDEDGLLSPHAAVAAQRQQAQKQKMQDEVKRIAANYSEEQQKHDLAMKVEQARQRQALQKKLLAKKEGKAKDGGGAAPNASVRNGTFGGGAGYPGDANVSLGGGTGKAGDMSFRAPRNLVPLGLANGISSRGMGVAPGMMRK